MGVRIPTTDTSSTITESLHYLSLGMSLLPIYQIVDGRCACGRDDSTPAGGKSKHSAGKHPSTQHGVKDASNDKETIRRWLDGGRNVGIATGAISGFFVLDIDIDKDGMESLRGLEAIHGKLPRTWTQVTGSGGYHLLFQHPGGKVKNSVCHLGAGLDVRGDGGYIVAPPSNHLSGKNYTWMYRPGGEFALADSPQWLLDLIANDKKQQPEKPPPPAPSSAPSSAPMPWEIAPYARKALDQECQAVASATEGTRNNALNKAAIKLAGYVAGGQLPDGMVASMLLDAAMAAGLDDKEANATIASGMGAGARTPKTCPQGSTASRAPRQEPHAAGEPPKGSFPFWREMMSIAPRVGPYANLHNVKVLLLYHPDLQGLVAFDEFRQAGVVERCPPWEGDKKWVRRDATDEDFGELTAWIQGPTLGNDAIHRMGSDTVRQAMDIVAKRRTINPVRDWLEQLKWDGKDRLSTWLGDYLGANDSDYTRAVARAWLISSVARIYQPGCKADGVLVLVGRQGALKSAALRVLGGEWFRDTVFDLANKDAFIQLRGAWIYELSELAAMSRADAERIKAFITSTVDVFRPPFGRAIVELPRRVVFAATTNNESFLKDKTGNRRFWPVAVQVINLAGLTLIRDQLFAQAVAAYRQGENWWLTEMVEEDAKDVQDEYSDVEPWEPQILKILATHSQVTVDDLLTVIEPDVSKWNSFWVTRVTQVLKKHGWERKQRRVEGVRQWFYVMPTVTGGGDAVTGGGDSKTVGGVSLDGCHHPSPANSIIKHKKEDETSHTHTCAHAREAHILGVYREMGGDTGDSGDSKAPGLTGGSYVGPCNNDETGEENDF